MYIIFLNMLFTTAWAAPSFGYDSRDTPECDNVKASSNLVLGVSRPWRDTLKVQTFTCDENSVSISQSESYLYVEYQGPWAPDMNSDLEGNCTILLENNKQVKIKYKFHLGCH